MDQTLALGSNLIMPIGVQSDLTLNYQWRFNGTNLAGQTNSVLTLDDVTSTNAGQYQVFMSAVSNGETNNWTGPVANVTVVVPTFSNLTMASGYLVASGFGGSPNGTFYVLSSSNLVTPQWTPISTNQFDAKGNFVFTNAINSSSSQSFYQLQLQ
jgi:hypothetical protein